MKKLLFAVIFLPMLALPLEAQPSSIVQFTGSNPSGNACVYTSPVLIFMGTQYICANGSTYSAVSGGSGCTLGGVGAGNIVFNNSGACGGIAVPTGVVKGNGTTLSAATAGTDYAGLSVTNTFTGQNDFHGVTHFFPRTGTTAAITGGTCTTGEVAWATDATAGNNWYHCTATNTWTQQLASTPGGTNGQVEYNNSGALGGFTVSGDATLVTSTGVMTLATVNSNTGSCGDATHSCQVTLNGKGLATAATSVSITAGTGNAAALVTLAFSATPTFTCPSSSAGTIVNFQATSNAPVVLTGNITSSTLASCTAGSILNFLFKQDGTGGRTIAWPSGFPSVQPNLAVNVTSTFSFYWDGANARYLNNSDAGYSQGTETGVPGANPTAGYEYLYFSSGRNTAAVLNSAGNTHIMPKTAGTTDVLASTDLSDTANLARNVCAATTLALATGAINSATCTSAQTATCTGLLTTDNVAADFNADPTGTTGYSPSTSGMLTIIKYPTANTINVKVCNNTSSTVTPGAVTLNVRGIR